MKVYFAICFAAVTFHSVSRAENLDKSCILIPDVKVKSCCTQSEIVEKKILDEAYAKVQSLNVSKMIQQCKLHEEIFVKLNLIKDAAVDKEASLKFIEEHVTDEAWKKVYKESMEICIPEMAAKASEIQKDSGVPIETCNYVFDATLLCMDITTFMSCPTKSIVNATGCSEAKEFVSKCYKNDNAMEKFAMMQTF